MIYFRQSILSFGQLVGQNQTFEDVTLGVFIVHLKKKIHFNNESINQKDTTIWQIICYH